MNLRNVALVINKDKPLAIGAGRDLINWLEARSLRVILEMESAEAAGRPDLAAVASDGLGEAELLIALGGDGTLINAAKLVAPLHVPVLGINLGHLGFLTELENSELFTELAPILDGEFVTEQRMMLTARVERQGELLYETTALNDAVVYKGPKARLVRLGVAVAGTTVAEYAADGVIVATPTGSTAYSLSAGGPVVGPTLDVLLITPICPHAMSSRAVVVSACEPVTVSVGETRGEVGLSTDGSDPVMLQPGDVVQVAKAPCDALLVRRHTYRFYDVLREKLAAPGR